MSKIVTSTAACLIVFALSSHASAAAITLGTASTVGVGETTVVDLLISDLGDGLPPSLGAYDLTVTFDAGLLQFVSGTFGDPVLGNQLDLAGFGSVSALTPGLGSIDLFELSLDPASLLDSTQAGTFVLAQLTLVGISEGTSPLGIIINALSDADGSPLAAVATGGSLGVISAPGPVPEPATLIYFGTGAAALTILRYRRNRGRDRRLGSRL